MSHDVLPAPAEHAPPQSEPRNDILTAPGLQTRAENTDRPQSPTVMYNPYYTGNSRTLVNAHTSDTSTYRQELIRRIKAGEERQHILQPNEQPLSNDDSHTVPEPRPSRKRKSPSPPTLLPSPEITPTTTVHSDVGGSGTSAGLDIERPTSALHRGDFRKDKPQAWIADGPNVTRARRWQSTSTPVSTSPVVPWHESFPVAALGHNGFSIGPSQPGVEAKFADFLPPARPRAYSLAPLSGSFTYQPPTSPLVNQANAADIPDHGHDSFQRYTRSDDRSRRHTSSPRSLHGFHSALEYPASARQSMAPSQISLRRESTIPYQAHQPRRSLPASQSVPQSPLTGRRRPSIPDGSPLQHAPMVGSYEESILRGRMSTTPSKPLDFVAQIGVLGKGDCKPSLKCPPHITVPFPAVFYSYSTSQNHAQTDDPEPSPYVGLIDLERSVRTDGLREIGHHGLIPPPPLQGQAREDGVGSRSGNESEAFSDSQRRMRGRPKPKRRGHPSRQPPSSGYRIPQQGQLQIVIKNPNKTAMKLFLLPYDLADMQPGQKTFLRQRSYSASPTIDMSVSSRKDLGTDPPEGAISTTSDPIHRTVLRYLVHLHICCPSKGRFYLYKSVRVVFANRAPDGNEKLCNEIQMPEPRYSAYKPDGRESAAGLPTPLIESDRQRRKSAAYVADAAYRNEHGFNTPISPMQRFSTSTNALTDHDAAHGLQPAVARFEPRPPPVTFYRLPTVISRPVSRGGLAEQIETGTGSRDDHFGSMSPTQAPSSRGSRGSRPCSAAPDAPDELGETGKAAETLSFARDSSGHERGLGLRTESLLSLRLRELAVRRASSAGKDDEQTGY